MCRTEKPITTTNKELATLTQWLRDQRARTGLTYRALAIRTGRHATTLQRAASGKNVPRLQTVLDYARACDASPEEARHLWKAARYSDTREARGGRSLPAPRAELVRDFAELSTAMQDMHEKAGSPSARTMEQRAGRYGSLPHSTVQRILKKRAVPHSDAQFGDFLKACDVPEKERPAWEAAWARAWRHAKREDLSISSDYFDDGFDAFRPPVMYQVKHYQPQDADAARLRKTRGVAITRDRWKAMTTADVTGDLLRDFYSRYITYFGEMPNVGHFRRYLLDVQGHPPAETELRGVLKQLQLRYLKETSKTGLFRP